MAARPDLAVLRSELTGLLAESEADRPLDSLESVVVHSYLTDRAQVPADLAERPTTIEGWVAWVAQHFAAS
jgi:hypothetical protein